MKQLLFVIALTMSSAFAATGACNVSKKMCAQFEGQATTLDRLEQACSKFKLTWQDSCEESEEGFLCDLPGATEQALSTQVFLYDATEEKATRFCELIGGELLD